MSNQIEVRPGLRDVIAGETKICKLDEQISKIFYFGYPIEELIEKHSFEETAYLTLYGDLPVQTPFRFGEADVDALRGVWATLQTEPRDAHPMGLLRTAMSALGNRLERKNGLGTTLEAEQAAALHLTPHIGYVVGLIGRYMAGQEPVMPVAGESYGGNILHMLRGSKPDAFEARCMDIALILYTEHEFNAGSFGVRVAASTHSDLYSSAVAGECILRGPRHGSANEESMHLMLDIGDPAKVKAYCDNFFAQPGARMPGFGHAVYNLPQSFDPRVSVLRPWVKELSRRKGDSRWHDIAMSLEAYMAERMKPRVARGNPNAPANMDLWTAPLYYLLGIPIPLYTPLFAASRIAGWSAHYLEVKYVNREPIIRPRADYVGPQPREYKATDHFGALDA
ncbi:MAG TPA: citrate/2-methylcitrate synthase [Dehalococcoidia bacterium]|nr:citrate/2-methylcitrate synthase [Dehalococcoidia bacterium]